MKQFERIIVSGPQRSGTTFAAQAIVGDLNYTYVDEMAVGVSDFGKAQALLKSGRRVVLQAPGLSHYLHHFRIEGLLVVFMIRPTHDIVASQERIGWADGFNDFCEYHHFNAMFPGFDMNQPISSLKYRAWPVQRAQIEHWLELDYESMHTHRSWVPPDKRRHFSAKQTAPDPAGSSKKTPAEYNAGFYGKESSMKTIDNVAGRLISKIARQDMTAVTWANQRLLEELQIAPIELLELFLLLKTVFGVDIKRQDADGLKTVAGLNAYIATRTDPARLPQARRKLAETKFVKVFADLAYRLGILDPELVNTLEAFLGMSVKKNLDLSKMKLSALYLMQDIQGGCKANCAFCVQSKDSRRGRKESVLVHNKLLRVPLTALNGMMEPRALAQKGVRRICIQTIYTKQTVDNLLELVYELRSFCSVPVTACCIPVSRRALKSLKEAGLDMIFINYEAATPRLFSEIRGETRQSPYRWEKVTQSIDDALQIFGDGKVGSHLQIGLGETPQDALHLIQCMTDKRARVSLLAFRPLQGTFLESRARSSHSNFHIIQLGSYLIQNHIRRIEEMTFDSNGAVVGFAMEEDELKGIIRSGAPFKNRGGCPGCNRIYYETDPGERFYTYPRDLNADEIKMIQDELLPVLVQRQLKSRDNQP